MNQKIITIAGILFAVIFIVALALVFKNVMRFTDTANKQLTHIQELVESADLSAYDRKVVSGDSVVSAINKFREASNGTKMSYVVIDADNENQYYGMHKFKDITAVKKDPSSVEENMQNIDYYKPVKLDDSNDDYTTYYPYDTTIKLGTKGSINPVTEYESYILMTENDVIIGVVFKEIK